MLRILFAVMFALTGLAFVTPSANAAACGTDNPFDDDGANATCRIPGTGQTCTVGAGTYGTDPNAHVTCDPPIIVCVREPCP